MIARVTSKAALQIFLAVITLFLSEPSALFAESKTPEEVVKIFISGYGTAHMEEVADVTTAEFRDNEPKSVWVAKKWKLLSSLEYAHIYSKVIDTKVKDDKAIVLVDAEITTKAADAKQKEVYTLVKNGGKWFIDDLIVADEKVDLEDYEL